MTQKEKQLLFKDLCARLPYGVKVYSDGIPHEQILIGFIPNVEHYHIKPYLRPMSSMTEAEKMEYNDIGTTLYSTKYEALEEKIDFLNSRHLDWRDLIPKKLALKAPEGMYKTKTE